MVALLAGLLLRRRSHDQLAGAQLQEALQLTLRCAVFYPSVVARVPKLAPDTVLGRRVLEWGAKMVQAGDEMARVLVSLRMEPRWSVNCAPDQLSPPEFFRFELVRLVRAASLLQEAASLARSEPVRQRLLELARGTEQHYQELWQVQEEFLRPSPAVVGGANYAG